MVHEISGDWHINTRDAQVVLYADGARRLHRLVNTTGVDALVVYKERRRDTATKTVTLPGKNTLVLTAVSVTIRGGNANSGGTYTTYLVVD